MTTALITGSTSGLGEEYAHQLAADGYSLVLTGRDSQKLTMLQSQLTQQYGMTIDTVVADLTQEEDIRSLEQLLLQRPIDLLINSAGIGLQLSFETNNIQDEIDHLKVHNEVPMRLMHAALSGMIQRQRGGIINVASIAGFIPRSTYSAVKNWLIGFSRWANERYRKQGITVTAVAPGYTRTNFHERLGLPKGEEGIPKWMWLDADVVVRESLRDARRGKALSIPSTRYKVLAAIARVLPARVTTKIGERGR